MLLLTLKAVVQETHLGRAHRRHCKIVSADFYPVNWLGEEKEQIGHRPVGQNGLLQRIIWH